VVRQVHYSVHNENSIDLVLFVNGIPVATAELKSHYTQSVQDAVYQYKTDREPFFKPKNVAEPLLAFPGGALVHFAVSNAAAEMTTRLAGLDTTFLPFNQGNAGGAGNPPKAGIATDYLWKEVWQRDSFLQILGRYLVPVKNAKKQLVGWIFPRYHQLTVTRKLVAAVTLEGPGNKYLVQHSAGSGKTNSIAWTAHFLADLHDAKDQKVFDTVIVISDRTVLDDQLREAIMSFERTQGVVAVITGEGASKSKELAEALSAGKKIVVCTVQTFPFALEEVRKLAATKGKRFAVIADEAHSSQTNETAAKLKLVLSAAEMAELIDGGECERRGHPGRADGGQGRRRREGRHHLRGLHRHAQGQDAAAVRHPPRPHAQAGARQHPGALPRLLDAPGHRGRLHPGRAEDLHLVQGGVLAGAQGQEIESKEVDKSEAMKGIMGWVRLHEYNIAQRVQVVVEHYRKHVAGLLGGQAKAMVVTGSRKEAVRWQKATRKYIADHGYKIETLVAFSGEVIDLDSGPDPFTEHSKELNPKLAGRTSAPPSRAATTSCCWWPTSSRPASTSRCCARCTWTSGWAASRPCRRSRA
jgi:type I restriction enzyme R subunit